MTVNSEVSIHIFSIQKKKCAIKAYWVVKEYMQEVVCTIIINLCGGRTVDSCGERAWGKREGKKEKEIQPRGRSPVRLSQSLSLSLSLSLFLLFFAVFTLTLWLHHSFLSRCRCLFLHSPLFSTLIMASMAYDGGCKKQTHTPPRLLLLLPLSPESLNGHFKAPSELDQFHIKAPSFSCWNHPATNIQSSALTATNQPNQQTNPKWNPSLFSLSSPSSPWLLPSMEAMASDEVLAEVTEVSAMVVLVSFSKFFH